jgi:hypothetical protein
VELDDLKSPGCDWVSRRDLYSFFGTTCKSFLRNSQGVLKLWRTQEPKFKHSRELLLINWLMEISSKQGNSDQNLHPSIMK